MSTIIKSKLRIGLDVDDVLVDWFGAYVKRYGPIKKDSDITRNINRHLKYDKDFWVNLELINKPNFEIELICTKRVINKDWTRESLVKNGINMIKPDGKTVPIYQVYCQSRKKSDYIKGRVDLFVDDSLSNFIEMNKNGVPCLLMHTENNKHWGPVGRVYSLDYTELMEAYKLLTSSDFK